MTYDEKIQKANELRQNQNYEEALAFYRELYSEVDNKFNLSGLLHCLRKTGKLGEAVKLAEEVGSKYLDFNWFKNEIVWTLIQGKLLKLPEGDIEKTIEIANEILKLEPDSLSKATVVFRVLKIAKINNAWRAISEWSSKLNPEKLDDRPMIDSKGRAGWSKKSTWYNYRINALIREEQYAEAETLLDNAITQYPRQGKFFIRLKGIIKTKTGYTDEAKECYEQLTNKENADWWLFHEYGRVYKITRELESALQLFLIAATKSKRYEASVKLYQDIAEVCMELDKYQEATAHLHLAKYIREEKGWNLPSELVHLLDVVQSKHPEITFDNKQSALNASQKIWSSNVENMHKNRSREKSKGQLSIPKNSTSFAFIETDKYGSIFCLKKDLPEGVQNGDYLEFIRKKSFDKKKNKESWIAKQINKI